MQPVGQTKDRPAEAGRAVQTKDRPAEAGRSLVCQFGLCDVLPGVFTPSGEHVTIVAREKMACATLGAHDRRPDDN